MSPCLLLSLLLLSSWTPDSAIDEMGCERVFGASQNGAKVLLCTGQFPRADLTLFDFETQSFKTIRDGRIKRPSHHLCAYKDGFLVVILSAFSTGQIVYLAGDGTFRDSRPLDSFTGYEDGFSLHAVYNYRPGLLLASFQKGDDEQTTYAALLDPGGQTFQEVAQYKDKQGMPHIGWISAGEDLYRISPFTGGIDQVDPATFQSLATVRRAEEPVAAKTRAVPIKVPAFARFKPLLINIMKHENSIFFTHTQFTGEKEETYILGRKTKSEKKIWTEYRVLDGGLTRQSERFLGRHQGIALIFDSENGSFHLQK